MIRRNLPPASNAHIHRDPETVKVLSSFRAAFGEADANDVLVVRAPGRVNLIGDHTDYHEGFVLPMTIDRCAYAALRARRDDTVILYAAQFDEWITYPLSERPETGPGTWAAYVTGAISELRNRLPGGFEMLVEGDVPIGAGLSSSAALSTAVIYGLDQLFGLGIDPIDAVHLSQQVEHRYAGVSCGVMDPFVSRLGRRRHALLLDCRSLDCEHVPLADARRDRNDAFEIVIADSGVRRKLADSGYNARRRECEEALDIIRETRPDVRSLRDARPNDLSFLAPLQRRRVQHVLEENDRVLQARDALRKGDFEAFGELMNQSHESLRDLYEVSCEELDAMVAAAQKVEGVPGSRMTGGGFGGCTVSLARPSAVPALREALCETCAKTHGRGPDIYVVRENHRTERL